MRVCVHWTRSELALLKKLVRDGEKIWEIEMPGRTKIAVRNKAIRLKVWQTKKRTIKSWSLREVKKLKHLVIDLGYTARLATSNGYFPGRSKDSISQQMRRLKIRRR